MSLTTGGRELGATSTKSSSDSSARRVASSIRTMPTCSPLGPTRRTSGTRMRSLIRGSLMGGSFWWSVDDAGQEKRPLLEHEQRPIRPSKTYARCAGYARTEPWPITLALGWEMASTCASEINPRPVSYQGYHYERLLTCSRRRCAVYHLC